MKNVYSVDIWKEKRRGNSASTVSSDKLCFVDHTRENINDGADFSAGTKERFRSYSSRSCFLVTRRVGALAEIQAHPNAKTALQDAAGLCGKIGGDRNKRNLANKS
jgi:hypothetical protein